MQPIVKFGIPLLAATHACLLAWMYIPEIGVCDGMRLPYEQVTDDMEIVLARIKQSESWDFVSVFEIFAMTVFAVHVGTKGTVTGGYKLLPFLLMTSTLVVRLRHMGLLGCSDGDLHCCANMGCPNQDMTHSLPGCGINFNSEKYGSLPIKWSRTSFCPIPCWYSAAAAATPGDEQNCKDLSGDIRSNCYGLYGTPDVASCYRYGCSLAASPIPYYGVRLLLANVILFVCLGFAAQIEVT